VALTAEGQAFLQHAHAVLQTADEAARLPFRRQAELAGRVELAATYTVLGYFLLPALARFKQLHPRVQVDLVELPREEIEARLHAGRLQMGALLLSNLAQPAGLQQRVLARSRRQLWVAGEHPLARLGSVPWRELEALPYILLQVDEGDRNALAYWQAAGGQPASFIRTSSMEALREMVALGLGVTILSDMVFRPWSLDGRRIRALPVDALLPVMEIGLAWAGDATADPCVDALQDFLGRAYGAPAAMGSA
jgi:DNA-binding transcriptional LysR family regulator